MSQAETSNFQEITSVGDYICPECGVIILIPDENNIPGVEVKCPKCDTESRITVKLWRQIGDLRNNELIGWYRLQSAFFKQRPTVEV